MRIQVIVTDPRVHQYGLPTNQTVGSAGLDLRVFLPNGYTKFVIQPGESLLFDTGLRIWIADPGYAGFMFARSGLGAKGLVLGNGTGIIDSDYQGPLKVCLYNRSQEDIIIADGDRVAQLVILPVMSGYAIEEVKDFDGTTERGVGGFGSTGTK